MALTGIADRKTPSIPIEIFLEAELGLPSANQEVLLIGHAASSTAASAINVVRTVNNSADADAAEDELGPIFGVDSELVKMVKAAINANGLVGASNFPQLKVVALDSADTGFGTSDAALEAVSRVKAEFVVSPYDGEESVNRDKLKNTMALMSGANRTDSYQFGSIGVLANMAETDPSALDAFDTQYLMGIWMPDTGTNPYSLGELAAASAARVAGNAAPFNPLDNVTIGGVDAPSDQADWITVGAGLESESALVQGWTPLRVKANGEVAFVRTVTGRITNGQGAPVTAYYDVQDWQVLYFWRKTIWTRLTQPDLKNVKASVDTAKTIKGELIRLATVFQDQNMFQAVAELAKQFVVERSLSDRHRFDVLTPVNVIPGLHVVAVRISAGTQFDAFSI